MGKEGGSAAPVAAVALTKLRLAFVGVDGHHEQHVEHRREADHEEADESREARGLLVRGQRSRCKDHAQPGDGHQDGECAEKSVAVTARLIDQQLRSRESASISVAYRPCQSGVRRWRSGYGAGET